jgi:putative phosphoribosyl transferase
MDFASRQDAGRKLGEYLGQQSVHADLVLGLPRGGVIVAAEVAKALHRPLDVLVVRKIGHPLYREFAVGALAEPDVVLLHDQAIEQHQVRPAELNAIIAEEQQRLREYRQRFAGGQPPDLAAKSVLLVDDGLATGSTMQAAVRSARQRRASHVLVAVPVTSEHASEILSQEADQVYALLVDPDFQAVGRYYALFEQTTDLEVMQALQESRCQPH